MAEWPCKMPMPKGDRLRVSGFEAFARICRPRWQKANGATGYTHFDCRGCATGKAICEGKLTRLPDNVELIEITEMIGRPEKPEARPVAVKQEVVRMTMKDPETKNAGSGWEPGELTALKPIPAAKLRGIDLTELKEYWLRPLLIKGKDKGATGLCPNCARKKTLSAAGICGACFNSGKGKKGVQLLAALRAAARRLNGIKEQEEPAETPSAEMPKEKAMEYLEEPEDFPGEVSDSAKGGKGLGDTVAAVCAEVRDMLLKKNAAYGNSAAEPVRIFSKCDPLEQINVRIDDKLSRLMRGHEYPGDDTELDLIGYLVMRRAIKRGTKKEAA